MRKWLVKNFVLDYFFTLFGTTFNAPRASRIIFPTFVITGLLVSTNPDWPTPTPLIWIMYFLCTVVLFFGFIYFKLYPAKWEELDELQKYQYGEFKYNELSSYQKIEWKRIYEKLLQKYSKT
jgi:hypothetical protein